MNSIENRLDQFIEYADKTKKYADAGFYRDCKSELTAAKAEIERLRGQYQELLAEKNFIGRKGLKALFLRKQAEAVEEMAYKVRKGQEEASHLVTAASIYEGLLSYSANYRQQANELEK